MNTKIEHKTKLDNQVNSLTFFIFICFLTESFFKLSVRSKEFGLIRPTLLFFGLTIILLITQMSILQQRKGESRELKALNTVILYIIISLPLVEYTGSVLKNNLELFIKAIVFFYFTYLIIDSYKRLVFIIRFYVLAQIFRVMEPLYLHLTEGYWGSSTYKGGGEFANRLSGAPADIINPNELGFVIVTIIPFLHYLILPKGKVGKILYFSLLTPLFFALVLTMSRGAFLALLVVGWFIWKKSSHKLTIIIFSICLALAAWSQMDDFQKDRYLSLVDSSSQNSATAEGRLNGIIAEFKLGLERPIVGHGVGTTAEAKYHIRGSGKASHNMYGELLMEIGLIGFILFLRFILTIRATLKENLELRSETPFYNDLSMALLVVFYMYAFYSINYYGLSQPYWYFLAGLSAALYRLKSIEAKTEKNDITKPINQEKR